MRGQPAGQFRGEIETPREPGHEHEADRSSEDQCGCGDSVARDLVRHEILPAKQDHHGGNRRQRENSDHAVDEDAQQRAGFFIGSLAHDEENFDNVPTGGSEQEEIKKHPHKKNPQAAPIRDRDALHIEQNDPAQGLQEQPSAEREKPRQQPPDIRRPEGLEHFPVLLRVAENPPKQAESDQQLNRGE